MIVTAAVKTPDDEGSAALLLATIRAARGGDERAMGEKALIVVVSANLKSKP